MMTATSGRRCSELLERYNPAMSWARTLLDSLRWWSSLRLLRWEACPTYSARVETISVERGGSPSTASAETLRVVDTQSRRLLFRLSPSERPTGGTGCGSSPNVLLPTPMASDKSRGLRSEYKRLPGGIVKSASGMTASLTEYAALGLLPTPTACDSKGGGMKINHPEMQDNRLGNYMHARFRPTPASKSSLLNPLFVEEMMGFPSDWLTAPFLEAAADGPQRP